MNMHNSFKNMIRQVDIKFFPKMVQLTGLLFPDKIKCIFFLRKSFFIEKCITFALTIHKKNRKDEIYPFCISFLLLLLF